MERVPEGYDWNEPKNRIAVRSKADETVYKAFSDGERSLVGLNSQKRRHGAPAVKAGEDFSDPEMSSDSDGEDGKSIGSDTSDGDSDGSSSAP
jgi:hypothetical protein